MNSSTKKDDVNTIGTFGAGFKSVFAITKTPEIHSGEYHFKITDYIVPEEIEPLDKADNTIIILPFNHSDISENDAYGQTADRLQKLESESLLFLRHIEEIKWCTESGEGNYLSEVQEEKTTLISGVDGQLKLEEYILFKKDIKIEDTRLNIAIAYLLDEDSEKIIPVADPSLFVFFPTNVKTRLKFHVHAPYRTTPSRESIPFDDEQNSIITNELSKLISKSLQAIKDRKLLNVDFLLTLPIDEEITEPLYKKVFEKVRNELSNNPLLPTAADQCFTSAEEALLAGQKGLSELLDDADCSALFERKYWINTAITYDRTRELRDYLTKVLKVPEITIEEFCKKISIEFIEEKPDQWIIDFYSNIKNSKALYHQSLSAPGLLRKKPIIRLEDGSHIEPDGEDGKIQVYLPSDHESEFKTVKRILSEDEGVKEFLKDLGLEKPDDIAEIKEFIIPKYNGNDIEEQDYLKDFKKVLTIWKQSDKYEREKIIDLMKKSESRFIRSKNYADEFSYQYPGDVYFSKENIKKWFQGNKDESVYFVGFDSDESKFLGDLGVCSKIKIDGAKDVTSDSYGYYKRSVNGFNPDFFIRGLDFSLNNINIDRSIVLWNILLEYPHKLRGCIKTKTNQNYPYIDGPEETSKALDKLNQNQNYWLYNNEKQLIEKPLDEIMLADLDDGYKKDHENIDRLVKALGLKLDEIKEFEEKHGVKVVSNEDYELLQEINNKKQNLNSKNQENIWCPKYDPDEVSISTSEPEFKPHDQKNLTGQGNTKTPENDNYDITEETENGIASNQVKNSKPIGDYGEKIAKRYLTKRYPQYDVVWLNENGSIGKGYDFVIRENDKDIFYYEVKSKVESKPQLFSISGTQWNWARHLYNKGQGDMYRILVVCNVEEKEVEVKEVINPVARWKEGKIYADPINIKL